MKTKAKLLVKIFILFFNTFFTVKLQKFKITKIILINRMEVEPFFFYPLAIYKTGNKYVILNIRGN